MCYLMYFCQHKLHQRSDSLVVMTKWKNKQAWWKLQTFVMEKYKQDVIFSLICKHGCPMRVDNSWTDVLVRSLVYDFLWQSPAKTNVPPNVESLLDEDIGFHSLGKSVQERRSHRVHTHTLITLIHSDLSNTCVLSHLALKVNPDGRD